jgi:hypothetical protein
MPGQSVRDEQMHPDQVFIDEMMKANRETVEYVKITATKR